MELAAEITTAIESSHSAIVVVEVADGIIGAVVDKVSDILSSTAIGSNRLGTWARLRPNLQLRNHSAEQGMVCFLSFEQRFGTNQDGSQLPSRLLLFTFRDCLPSRRGVFTKFNESSNMSKVIAINFGQQAKTDTHLESHEDAQSQRLEQERLQMIQITNHLEALYARLLTVCGDRPKN